MTLNSKKKNNADFSKGWIILAIPFLTAFLVSVFVVRIYLVDGPSMEPTLKANRPVLVWKLSRDYETGDVIVFKSDNVKSQIIKRIAAKGGDEIVIKEGKLFVNGEVSPRYENIANAGTATEPVTVPEGCFFVIGDNFNNSIDSRSETISYVSRDEVVGKVLGY